MPAGTSSKSDLRITRRSALSLLAAPTPELIESIETRLIWEGKKARACWLHPKIAKTPQWLLMTVQLITASDVMHQPHFSESTDGGRTWSERKPIPALERVRLGNGCEDVVSDVVPEYHERTGTVLCLGQDVHYENEKLVRPDDDRWIRYFVRRKDGSWSKPRKLEFPHEAATRTMSAGCGQRLTMPNGDVLVPVAMLAQGVARTVSTMLCAFDGETLTPRRMGTILSLPIKRGLLEPSLTRFAGQYWMTIRSEDDRAHYAVSRNGLDWGKLETWRYDDGEELVTSSTQQHWVRHREALFLAYTRRDASNLNVLRWRTPTYLAEVDTKRGVLLRGTERIVVPRDGDAMHGNFHVTHISRRETVISLGDLVVDNPFRGDTLLTFLRWRRDNDA